jgi:FlgD Ig-like domain
MAALEEFRDVYGMRFLGLEDPMSSLYSSLRVPDPEAPYPQDIIIDQQGNLRYWSWEYDPWEIMAVIDSLLITASDIDPQPPQFRLVLLEPRPSIFSRETDILFQLPAQGPAKVTIYDAMGRLVRTLVDSEMNVGRQRVSWDGKNQGSRPVTEGFYFIKLNAAGQQRTQRVLRLR